MDRINVDLSFEMELEQNFPSNDNKLPSQHVSWSLVLMTSRHSSLMRSLKSQQTQNIVFLKRAQWISNKKCQH